MIANELSYALDEMKQPCPHLLGLKPRARHVRREEEERQHEDEIPDRGERSDQPIAFARRLIDRHDRGETEQGLAGLRIGDDEARDDDEADEAADIADGPAGAG